jgi:molybdate transport system ATP-binding protein
LLVLFGHSGSGKSLTLRAIAGLLTPDAGRIVVEDQPVFDAEAKIDVPPRQRGVGLVVQSYALFPTMTVAENIAFGLHGWTKAARQARVQELMKLLAIEELARRRPAQVSGGQAQRVALARALAPRPRLLLLDEPFSALDNAIRVTLRRELARLKRDLDLTIVFVTHDLREAFNLADRIAVFESGTVLQVGTRDDVFNRPASARVAALTEVRNVWRGRIVRSDAAGVSVETGRFRVEAVPGPWRVGDTVDVCIRPERVVLVRPDRPRERVPADALLTGTVVEEVAHGESYTLFVRAGDDAGDTYDLEIDIAAHPYAVLGVGRQRTWTIALPREAVHLMPAGPARS